MTHLAPPDQLAHRQLAAVDLAERHLVPTRAGWISMLLLECLQKQCHHPAQGSACCCWDGNGTQCSHPGLADAQAPPLPPAAATAAATAAPLPPARRPPPTLLPPPQHRTTVAGGAIPVDQPSWLALAADLPTGAGWGQHVATGMPTEAVQPPGSKDSLSLSRVDQHGAVGTPTERGAATRLKQTHVAS